MTAAKQTATLGWNSYEYDMYNNSSSSSKLYSALDLYMRHKWQLPNGVYCCTIVVPTTGFSPAMGSLSLRTVRALPGVFVLFA